MKSIAKFIDIDECIKDTLRKQIPDLANNPDFDFSMGNDKFPCLRCNERKVVPLFYRIVGTEKWNQVDSLKICRECEEIQLFEQIKSESELSRKKLISERINTEYFLIPDVLKSAGFKNYVETNKVTAKAKEETINFTQDFLHTKGNTNNLLIMGNPGTGKTHLCVAIARTIKEKEASFTVGFLTTGKLLSLVKETYSKGATKTERDIFDDIKNMDLLILDDLGSEVLSSKDDWRKATIFEVVESRSGKPTIYTSNLTDVDLPFAVGERVFSRLNNNTKFIDLFTDDYRKKLRRK